jgi:hypothetical protein
MNLALCVAVALLVSGCAGQMAYREGNALVAQDQVEAGLLKYQEAVAADPTNAAYKTAWLNWVSLSPIRISRGTRARMGARLPAALPSAAGARAAGARVETRAGAGAGTSVAVRAAGVRSTASATSVSGLRSPNSTSSAAPARAAPSTMWRGFMARP